MHHDIEIPFSSGFTKISNRVIDDESLTGYAKLVFIAISRFSDRAGRSWPSVPTIAKKAGISERQVRYEIRSLREKGYLRIESRPGKSSMYVINTPAPRAEVEDDPCTTCSPPLHSVQGTPAPRAAEQDLRTRSKNKRSIQKNLPSDYSNDFLAFWTAYPKKEGKAEAYRIWQKLLRKGFTSEQLILAGKRYAAKCEKEGTERQYIKKGVNFLRHRTFEDYLHEAEERASEEPTQRTLQRYLAQAEAILRG